MWILSNTYPARRILSEALSPVHGRDDGNGVIGVFDDLFTKLLQLVHRRHDAEEGKERKGEEKRREKEEREELGFHLGRLAAPFIRHLVVTNAHSERSTKVS